MRTIFLFVSMPRENMPCFFAFFFLRRVVFMQLQPKPRIDYILKAVGGSLTAMPGLSDMIDV
jgi:hypothetical protein